jgi:hypothetical protein
MNCDNPTQPNPTQVNKKKNKSQGRTFHVPLGGVLELREGKGVTVRASARNGEVSLACRSKRAIR